MHTVCAHCTTGECPGTAQGTAAAATSGAHFPAGKQLTAEGCARRGTRRDAAEQLQLKIPSQLQWALLERQCERGGAAAAGDSATSRPDAQHGLQQPGGREVRGGVVPVHFGQAGAEEKCTKAPTLRSCSSFSLFHPGRDCAPTSFGLRLWICKPPHQGLRGEQCCGNVAPKQTRRFRFFAAPNSERGRPAFRETARPSALPTASMFAWKAAGRAPPPRA